MNRTKAYNRYQHKKHALRHRRITREVYREPNYFKEFNKYDSFKIHCSCPLCRAKTAKNKQIYGSGAKNWPISDRRKLESMEDQILDNEQENVI